MENKMVNIARSFLIIFGISIFISFTNKPFVVVKKDIMIPLSDGVKLAANIVLPQEQGEYPVILVRTPYGKDNEDDEWGEYWAENGYAFVIQDCRGTGNSKGQWYPGVNEKKDGIDTYNWVLSQSWCNGSIATTGASYLGYTQLASAMDYKENLKAMFAYIPILDWYRTAYESGALTLSLVIGWGLEMADPSKGEGALMGETFDLDKVLRTLPLTEFDKSVDTTLTWMREWIKNPVNNTYWEKYAKAIPDKNNDIPLITVAGWYDIFAQQALDYHGSALKNGLKNQYLIIGPWPHAANYIAGERQFGDNHQLDFESLEKKWFDIWLKGKKEQMDLPSIKLYVMGKNEWRDEKEWPLQRTKYTNYYLHSAGKANSLNGDGMLSLQMPAEQAADQFTYDPQNPVPTHGGALLYGESGPYDQQEIEKRKDMLVFSSQVLKEELEVTGPVKVILYASSESRDTDWTAKLVDVYPDGRAFNLCDGIVRARFHKNAAKPGLINPGQIYKYEIDLWSTSNVFLPDHKIRVEISSSNFPRFDRNPNTGNKFGMDDELRITKQTIYHNEKYPSHIVLPVIPHSE